jgi:6-phosphogluconolactonase
MILPDEAETARPESGVFVYAGTHQLGGESRGIYAWLFYPRSGTVRAMGLAAEITNPFVLATGSTGSRLYVGTNRDGHTEDELVSLAVDLANGRLRILNSVRSRGVSACHLATDTSGRRLIAVNYRSGNVAAFDLRADGSIGGLAGVARHEGSSLNPDRQEAPHPHGVVFSPDNRYALVADLGLDQIRIYHISTADGQMQAGDPAFASVPRGAGPRHLVFAHDGRHVFVVNELQSSVTAFSWNPARGTLVRGETISVLPSGFEGTSAAAEIALSPDGRFLYVSNRGADNLAVFSVDALTGSLKLAGHVASGGREPWSFAISPDGSSIFVANKLSDSVVVFRLDPATGLPKATGVSLRIPSPVCVTVVDAR